MAGVQPGQNIDLAQQGDPTAGDELLPLVYGELRRLAAQLMAREAPGQTLQPTALVHEAWLRLAQQAGGQGWEHRGHFFAAAAEAMRRILVENARRKSRRKRGGGWERIELDDIELAVDADPAALLSIDESLAKLGQEHPEEAQLVKLRFFGGLTLPEASRALGISQTTAKRHWTFARAWLYGELAGGG
jgi:RNA polymerase sigma factor (TIGR02999 family)